MTTKNVIFVEGASDLPYLDTLSRRIAALSVERIVFVTAAHEIAHHLVTLNGANNTGMTYIFDVLDLLRRFGRPVSERGPISFGGDDTSPTLVIPKYYDASALRLASSVTRDFAALSRGWRLDRSETEPTAPTYTRPQITLRLSADIGSVIPSVRTMLLRLLDTLLALARRCTVAIEMLRFERSLVLARLGCLPGVPAFVLVILAVCRRYGHRSEPDDHASLLIRRQLVSMGSCPPT